MMFLALLLTLQAFSEASEVKSQVPLFPLPAVDFSDLSVLDELAVSTVANALTTVGALQITGIPHFASARSKALQPAAACLLADSSAPSVQMGDNKHRVSSAAVSTHGTPGPMSGECGQAADALRATVDGAVYQLLKSMDKYSGAFQNNENRNTPEFVMEPYRRYSDIYQHGEHLEHLHSFFDSDSAKSSALSAVAPPTMDFHTDAGLFIAMTTGLYTSEKGEVISDETNGLYLKLLSGAVVEVQTTEDALIVMVGDGGARWLAPMMGANLRAAPHSLRVSSSTQQAHSRSWFGKMFLPPADAILPMSSISSGENVPLKYEAYRKMERNHLATPHSSSALPSACGHGVPSGVTRRSSSNSVSTHGAVSSVLDSSYSHLVGNDLCSGDDGTGVMCWTQCYSVEGLPCGTSAECVDTATGEVVDGTQMCPSDHNNCELQCVDHGEHSMDNATDIYDDYCWGSGVTMYMSGFKAISSSKKGHTECINLFFDTWTLDNDSVFAGACIGVFLLGLVIESLVMARRLIFAKMEKTLQRDVLMVLLHGVNVVLSYFVMLVAMTYNVELFCMAVSGLTVGFMLFNLAEPPRHKTDPCCSLGHEKEDVVLPADLWYGSSGTPVEQTVSYELDGGSAQQDAILAKVLVDEVLAIKGVRTCHRSDSGFDITFYGDSILAHHIAVVLGQSLGGVTVHYQEFEVRFFKVSGMTCGSCTETVRRAASKVEGVKFCGVNLQKELCGIAMPRAVANSETVIDAIDAVGFDANVVTANRV